MTATTTTSTEAALRAAIALHPCDDTPVLLLADELDDQGRYEDARDARLTIAHRGIIRNPDDMNVRLRWAELAESVPVNPAALEDVRRELKAWATSCRQSECGTYGYGPCSACREMMPPRAREAALVRTAALHRRAEFVRVQCELHAMGGKTCPPGRRCPSCAEYDELSDRERELCRAHGEALVKDFAASVGLRRFLVDHSVYVGVGMEWDWSRGFIESLTCTAEAWFGDDRAPGLCERLWWDAGQTVPCGACGGRKGLSVYERGEYGPNRYFEDCPTCHGSGELPRPIPTTAVPLRKLTLSTMPPPAWMMSSIPRQRMTGPPTAYVGESERKRCLENIAAKCPGLDVVLPG